MERARREVADSVADTIKGRTGPDYLRLGQCIEIIKRNR
jgi:hypothetical protein